jgi:pimeloyl-ACP methyl ester carboxylesterase
VTAHGLANDVPLWSEDGWKQGDDSLSTASHPRAARESSFDTIFAILRDVWNHHILPNLNRVVLVGHSAGGPFVQRFAAAGGPNAHIARYVVANPSSYLVRRWNPSDEGWILRDDAEFRLGSSPAVITDGAGVRDVYVRNRDDSVGHKYWLAE